MLLVAIIVDFLNAQRRILFLVQLCMKSMINKYLIDYKHKFLYKGTMLPITGKYLI